MRIPQAVTAIIQQINQISTLKSPCPSTDPLQIQQLRLRRFEDRVAKNAFAYLPVFTLKLICCRVVACMVIGVSPAQCSPVFQIVGPYQRLNTVFP